MSKIPCKQCLTISMCQKRYSVIMSDNTHKHQFPIMKMSLLVDECPYFKEWYDEYTINDNSEHENIEQVKKTFNAHGVTWY